MRTLRNILAYFGTRERAWMLPALLLLALFGLVIAFVKSEAIVLAIYSLF